MPGIIALLMVFILGFGVWHPRATARKRRYREVYQVSARVLILALGDTKLDQRTAPRRTGSDRTAHLQGYVIDLRLRCHWRVAQTHAQDLSARSRPVEWLRGRGEPTPVWKSVRRVPAWVGEG
jgi:hypothetical protein